MNIGAECVTTDALRNWCQGINGGGSSIHSNKSPRTEALQVLRHWLLSSLGAVPTWVIFGYFWKQGSIPSSQSQNCCNLITVSHVDLIIWPSALNPEPRQTSGTTGGCSSGKGCKDTKWYKQGHTIYDSSWWALSHITDQQWDSSKVSQPSRKFWKVCGNAGIMYLSQTSYSKHPPQTTNTN